MANKKFTVFFVQSKITKTDLTFLGENGFESKSYTTCMEFIFDYKEKIPGVLIIDIPTFGADVRDILLQLVEKSFPLPVVLMSTKSHYPLCIRLIREMRDEHGAYGVDFICKSGDDAILGAVQRAYDYYYDRPREVDIDDIQKGFASLSSREHEILHLVLCGDSSMSIKNKLGLSVKTVEAHRTNINDKMRADDVSDLVRKCFNNHDFCQQ